MTIEEIALSSQTSKEDLNKDSSEASVKVEDVFTKLGGYSRFQLFATLVIVSLEIPAGMIAMSPILTGSTNVDFYCDIDGNRDPIPKDDICRYNCSGSITSNRPFVSIVQDFNLICEHAWMTDTFTSIQMVGSMLGPILIAQVADRFGRKKAFFLVCLLMGISGALSSLSPDKYSYAFSRFLAGFAVGGGLVAHMNYLMEFLTPSWRVICGCVNFWPLGEMILGLLGYLIPSWRQLSWVISMPAVFLFVAIPFLPESPRWLLTRKRTAEATTVLNTIANWNSKPHLDPQEIKQLQECVLKEASSDNVEDGIYSVFKNRLILKQLLIFALAWFANAVTFYGLSFNMKNMSGNPYINLFLFGVIDWPAELSGIFFSNRFGRKFTFLAFLVLGVGFLAILVGMVFSVKEEDYAATILILCLLGRFCNEASWSVMACFTGESFPTTGRSIAFSICTASSSMGGIIAPQIAYFGSVWKPGPYIIFCAVSLLSVIPSSMLTEMKGKPLQDMVKTEE